MNGYLVGLVAAATAVSYLVRKRGKTKDKKTPAQHYTSQKPYRPRPTFVPRPYSNPIRFRDGFAPAEKDRNLRTFNVLNPEGEVYTVNTADESSGFYGPVWTRVLSAYESGEYLRGRASVRRTSKDEGRFSGYSVSIDGLEAFLPKSKASFFFDPKRDATNKCLALKVEMIQTNGDKKGNIVVSAKEPWEQTLDEFSGMTYGKEMHALAEDYEHNELLFPGFFKAGVNAQWLIVSVPIDRALQMAGKYGVTEPNFLTGLYWKLRLTGFDGDKWNAEPLDVLI
ncbi:hypothetical protein AGMMS50276_00050 [Synergistales bacterium]|nr:hypothetical protein AGMMS50276_00050 [Synergistales bacterium]